MRSILFIATALFLTVQAQVMLPHRRVAPILNLLGPCRCLPESAPSQPLLARWTFDETNGYFSDDVSGNTNTMLLLGGVTHSTYQGYSTALLDGVSAFMRTYGPFNMATNKITLTCVLRWVYETSEPWEEWLSLGGNPYLEGQGSIESVIVHSNSTISVDILNGDGTIDGLRQNYALFATNQWIGFGQVYDNSTTNGDTKLFECSEVALSIDYKTNKNWSGSFDKNKILYIGAHGITNGLGGWYNAHLEFRDLRFYAGELSQAELCYVFSHHGDSGTTSGFTSLTNSLVSYWPMEERSGTRYDIWGTNHLSVVNNSIDLSTNRVQNGAKFTWYQGESGTNALYAADSPGLSSGSSDFTLTGWISMTTTATNYAFVAKRDDSNTEYQVRYFAAGSRFYFDVWTGAAFKSVAADALGAPNANTCYFFAAWMDTSADALYFQINAGSTNSIALAGQRPSDTTAPFYVGTVALSPPTGLNGNVDEVGFWKRVLTLSERQALYNSGYGASLR